MNHSESMAGYILMNLDKSLREDRARKLNEMNGVKFKSDGSCDTCTDIIELPDYRPFKPSTYSYDDKAIDDGVD